MLPPAQPGRGSLYSLWLLSFSIKESWEDGPWDWQPPCLYTPPPPNACRGFSSMTLVGLTSRRLHMQRFLGIERHWSLGVSRPSWVQWGSQRLHGKAFPGPRGGIK